MKIFRYIPQQFAQIITRALLQLAAKHWSFTSSNFNSNCSLHDSVCFPRPNLMIFICADGINKTSPCVLVPFNHNVNLNVHLHIRTFGLFILKLSISICTKWNKSTNKPPEWCSTTINLTFNTSRKYLNLVSCSACETQPIKLLGRFKLGYLSAHPSAPAPIVKFGKQGTPCISGARCSLTTRTTRAGQGCFCLPTRFKNRQTAPIIRGFLYKPVSVDKSLDFIMPIWQTLFFLITIYRQTTIRSQN